MEDFGEILKGVWIYESKLDVWRP